jgi:hypothetical protein
LGGAKYLSPLLESMQQDSFDLIVHPISARFIDIFLQCRYQLFNIDINDTSAFWESEIKKYHSIVLTTSSKYIDDANSKLIEIARNAGIPTLGFLDHWKGFDRFYDHKQSLVYLPNWLGVIDRTTINRLNAMNIKPEKTILIGHPWLDYLHNIYNSQLSKESSKKILLVSQPDIKENFNSIFCEHTAHERTTKYLKKMSSKGYNSFYRPHPKESKSGFANLPIDDSDFMNVLNDYDIFIGYDSMMLLEAASLGKIVLYLDNIMIKNNSDHSIPISYGQPLEEFSFLSENELIITKEDLFKNSILEGKKTIKNFIEKAI